MIWILSALMVVITIGVVAYMKVMQYKAIAQMDVRKKEIDETVKSLSLQLEKYQQLLRQIEEDRNRKYGNLETELKNTSAATLRLQESTNHLNNILGNVKLRGQWGERMAEDIIQYAGLIENINYTKQLANTSSTKPDFTFLLPSQHKINMDVKFPLDNYLHMVNAAVIEQKEMYQKEFIRNVKERIKEIQNRDYINASEKTLDFVLLFIPNEQVFGFIQEKMPELMDLALKQKVVLCSPFTLYAMLSVIRQAHENFRYEKDLKEIIGLIEQFSKYYAAFKVRFETMGDAITKLNTQYQDILDKNFKQLDGKIKSIDEYKKGQLPLVENKALDVPSA